MKSFLPGCFLLALTVTISYGCTCQFYLDKRPIYCSSDFVVRATIKNRDGPYLPDFISGDLPSQFVNAYGYYRYHLQIHDEILTTDIYLNRNGNTMVAFIGELQCGVTLNVSSTYIISGKVISSGTELSTTLCNAPEAISPDENLPEELDNLDCDIFSMYG